MIIVNKDKLPKGWSYALKPSRLESAMSVGQIKSRIYLHQCFKTWAVSAPAMSAKFHPSGSPWGGENGGISIESYAIPSDQRKIAFAFAFAEDVFLPALIAWITRIEALPEDYAEKRTEQEFSCDGSPPALCKRPLPLFYKGQPKRKGTVT